MLDTYITVCEYMYLCMCVCIFVRRMCLARRLRAFIARLVIQKRHSGALAAQFNWFLGGKFMLLNYTHTHVLNFDYILNFRAYNYRIRCFYFYITRFRSTTSAFALGFVCLRHLLPEEATLLLPLCHRTHLKR